MLYMYTYRKMYSFLTLCLIFLVPVSASLSYPRTGSRIVGGADAPPGAAPHQASLRNVWNSHFCGGSILSERWVLTAAHCTVGSTAVTIKVVVGTNTLNAGGVRYNVQKIFVHENYDHNLIVNDVSLLRLTEDITFGDLVQPIQLPTVNTEGGADLVLTGWGRTSSEGLLPNQLQTINLTALSFEDCRQRLVYVNSVFSSEICSLTKSGEGACNGDSGGPLVENGRVVGIVSWGIPCAAGYPDVYTRVYSFLNWIQLHMTEYSI